MVQSLINTASDVFLTCTVSVKYCPVSTGMTDNGSACGLSDSEIQIISLTYTGLSFLSLIVGLIALLLNRYYYYRYKERQQIDPMEDIFFTLLAICCIYEFFDCFQWFALLDNFVGCSVLGAVREYTLISLLVIIVCLGTHLLIVITQPKCLQVINEVKLKRYKLIQRIYVTASFLVPAIFVPWPFLSVSYGKQGYACWLRDTGCGTSGISNVLTRLLMWYFWALLVWLFAVAVFAFSFYTYCSHKRRTTWKPDLNSTTIISVLTAFILQLLVSVLLLMWGWIRARRSFILTFLGAVLIPLALMTFFIILNIRQVSILRTWHRLERIVNKAKMTTVTYKTVSEGEPTSISTFYVLPEDDWDNINKN